MKTRFLIVIILFLLQVSCAKFVEIEVPDYKIISKTVFSSDETAERAVLGIYNELPKADFSNGDFSSVTTLSELSADNFNTTTLNYSMIEFEQNNISPNNSYNLNLWSSAYKIIYMCNAVLEGLEFSEGISSESRTKFSGEAKFVRAFAYFYLVNLYGEVPIVLTTDYRKNAVLHKSSIEDVYGFIINDLNDASTVLGNNYIAGERIRASRFTAMALLARVYLFLEDWEMAEVLSNELIESSENYTLLKNLDEVFLANSKEAIWQISPAGRGPLSFITNEARIFILNSPPPNSQKPVALSDDFLNSFNEEDRRLVQWIGNYNTGNQVFHYPYKYKVNSSSVIEEYSMVLRLAEQYLIRAEARAYQDRLSAAITDLNKIRERAQLPSISSSTSSISRESVLDSIQIERRRELFTEWGHRWLDLKRTGMALSPWISLNSNIDNSDLLYPIPDQEIIKNPNLIQNEGY